MEEMKAIAHNASVAFMHAFQVRAFSGACRNTCSTNTLAYAYACADPARAHSCMHTCWNRDAPAYTSVACLRVVFSRAMASAGRA